MHVVPVKKEVVMYGLKPYEQPEDVREKSKPRRTASFSQAEARETAACRAAARGIAKRLLTRKLATRRTLQQIRDIKGISCHSHLYSEHERRGSQIHTRKVFRSFDRRGPQKVVTPIGRVLTAFFI